MRPRSRVVMSMACERAMTLKLSSRGELKRRETFRKTVSYFRALRLIYRGKQGRILQPTSPPSVRTFHAIGH